MVFAYGEIEIAHLKRKDKRLGAAIDSIGHIERAVDGELFTCVVRHIVGQQISAAALATIWQRMSAGIGEITPAAFAKMDAGDVQKYGITYKKAEYIKDFAQKVACGALDLQALALMPNGEVIQQLSSLKGIGVWTAEMILLFGLSRADILSFGDLGIHRGMRMLYHHRRIDSKLFEKYRRRYSPFGSVASLYLWAISAGAIPGMRDYAPSKKAVKV